MTTAVMTDTDTALMAHLLRRAGFGATRDQIDEYVAKGYDETVEELLHPEYSDPEDQDLLDRYFIASVEARSVGHADPQWAWRMATTTKHLEEKIALFWHGLLAVGGIKLDHGMEMLTEIDLFRRYGLGKFGDLLLEISRNPGMMYWLDNQNSHKDAPNENYGRELLELFSMGIDEMGEGAYTEDDVKAAARAFTGWASKPTMPPFFLGPFPMEFQFDPDDHDDGEKEFLGEVGNWNGEDIVEITVRQRATAEFISRRLYQFFVADDADEDEVQRLADVFEENDGEIRAVLRAIFKSDHFKSEAVRYRKVKSPTELVFGVARLTDRFDLPDMDVIAVGVANDVHGTISAQPAERRGLARGRGVDRQRCTGRANQLRLDRVGTERRARHPANGGPCARGRRPEFHRVCVCVPRRDGLHRRLGPNIRAYCGTCIRSVGTDQRRRRNRPRDRDVPVDRIDTRLPVLLIQITAN